MNGNGKIRRRRSLLLLLCVFLSACSWRLPWQPAPDTSAGAPSQNTPPAVSGNSGEAAVTEADSATSSAAGDFPFDLTELPVYAGAPSIEVNGGQPCFTPEEISHAEALAGLPAPVEAEAPSAADPGPSEASGSNIRFSELDALGRAGVAVAVLSKADMATAEREALPGVKPSGWHNAKYEGIDRNFLYNRCHLLGYQLTAENGDIRNLITGTRYLNIEGMLPHENRAAGFLRRNRDMHILYRVTPVFAGENLLASGVLMEAVSLEDGGEGLRFCTYCFNVQPGIRIDYATGENEKE